MTIKTVITPISSYPESATYRLAVDPTDHTTDRTLPEEVNHILRIAVAAVDKRNEQQMVTYRESAMQASDGVTEASTVEPDLPKGLPVEHIKATLPDGTTHDLVVLVTDSIYRTSYQLAVITYLDESRAEVELSGWDSYDNPLIAGPWIWFSENFDTTSTLGLVQWSNNGDWFRQQSMVALELVISTGLPALDALLGGGLKPVDKQQGN